MPWRSAMGRAGRAGLRRRRAGQETEAWFPWAERVIVKRAESRRAAASVHPRWRGSASAPGAKRAVERAGAGELRVLDVGQPITLEAEYANAGMADYAAIVPGTERYGDRGVRVVTDDPIVAYRTFLAGVRLAGLVD